METTLTLISTVATAASAVVAAVAFLLALRKYRERLKAEHADRMFDLLMRIRKDSDTVELFRKIDFSEGGWYGDSFTNSEFEKPLTMPCSNLNTSCI